MFQLLSKFATAVVSFHCINKVLGLVVTFVLGATIWFPFCRISCFFEDKCAISAIMPESSKYLNLPTFHEGKVEDCVQAGHHQIGETQIHQEIIGDILHSSVG